MSYQEMNEARNMINDLLVELRRLVDKDPDQEIWSYAYSPIDAALSMASAHLQGHAVVEQVRELFSPETVAEGSSVRVADVLPVVALLGSLLNSRVSEIAMRMNEEERRSGLPPYLRDR